ncbi:unnamed protein product [Moneuplotes crassus]|uniref:Uncharacterized protein n=1 Tax=Euplotes crassus TaxID=5936 RepID=A0AAD2CZQ6_EUPCR|nr:unnamed protein product [Moneuplotes crassus]
MKRVREQEEELAALEKPYTSLIYSKINGILSTSYTVMLIEDSYKRLAYGENYYQNKKQCRVFNSLTPPMKQGVEQLSFCLQRKKASMKDFLNKAPFSRVKNISLHANRGSAVLRFRLTKPVKRLITCAISNLQISSWVVPPASFQAIFERGCHVEELKFENCILEPFVCILSPILTYKIQRLVVSESGLERNCMLTNSLPFEYTLSAFFFHVISRSSLRDTVKSIEFICVDESLQSINRLKDREELFHIKISTEIELESELCS